MDFLHKTLLDEEPNTNIRGLLERFSLDPLFRSSGVDALLPHLDGPKASMLNYRRDRATNYGCPVRDDSEIVELLTGFRYRRIQKDSSSGVWFRLLKLLPRGQDGRICCEMKAFPMRDCPKYDALSYCWGTAPRSLTILCNGRELPVTATIASALSRLQLRGCEYIWIDAICINQDDLRERESQVQVMQRIYGRASRVWIWIAGEKATDAYGFASKVAFPVLELYAKDPSAAIVARKGKPIPEYVEWTTTSSDEYGNKTTNHHNNSREIAYVKMDNTVQKKQNSFTAAMEHILQQPWFDRVWCVQEAIMGRRAIMLSGPHEIEWDVFCRGLKVATELDESCQQTWGALRRDSLISRRALNLAMYQRPGSNDTPASFLLALLFKYRARKATDPRDKVYALLGIVSHFHSQSSITVSYSKDVRDVYRDTAMYILSESKTLHMLAACGQESTVNVPMSWVTDWSSNYALPKPFWQPSTSCHTRYRATSESKVRIAFASDGSLILRGLLIDSVKTVGRELPLDDSQGRDWSFRDYTAFAVRSVPLQLLTSKSGNYKGLIRGLTGIARSELEVDNDVPLWRDLSNGQLKTQHLAWLHGAGMDPTWLAEDAKDLDKPVRDVDPNDDNFVHRAMRRPKFMECSAGKRLKFLARQVQVFLGWDHIANHRDRRSRHVTGGTYSNAYWQTLTAGNFTRSIAETSRLFRDWQTCLAALEKFDDANIENLDDQAAGWLYMLRRPEEQDLEDLLERSAFAPLLEHAYHRKFARTSKGYYCLAPSGAQEGDLIALFEGGDVPIVVREFGEKWLIVGECYVHGVMNGEAYDATRCKEFHFR